MGSDNKIRLSDELISWVEAYYSRSNEKPILAEKLGEILAGKKFEYALDVGPGPGLVTQPLACRTKQLTLVEITSKYTDTLKSKFPNAKVVVSAIEDFPLNSHYDCILYSQGLYYQPEDEWLSICSRMFNTLTPGGLLILVLNRDSGDWWKIVSHFWGRSPKNKAFHYRRSSEFKKQLAELGEFQTHVFYHQHHYSTEEEFAKLMAYGWLAIQDEEHVAVLDEELRAFANNFRDGDRFIANVDCEILVLKK